MKLPIALRSLLTTTAVAGLVALPGTAAARPAVESSVVDVAVAANADGPFAGQFDTLTALLAQYPHLVSALDARGQYTVFAPTDAAFEALFAVVPPQDLTAEQVEDVLRYHVAVGRRDAAAVTGSSQIRMLNGDFAAVDGATIDGAAITVTDVFATNGVIHVVDAVLLPPTLG